MTPIEQVDFFISYNYADKSWAEWIAWEVEHAGYSTVVEVWDFRPGSNWAIRIDEACKQAKRIVAVITPAYLSSTYTRPEWARYFAVDPEGRQHLVVPVMVARCVPDGLLRGMVDIKLFDCAEDEARTRLLTGIDDRRAKPQVPPPFPGVSPFRPVRRELPVPAEIEPLTPELDWLVGGTAGGVAWRADMPWPRSSSAPYIEAHIVPGFGSEPLDPVDLAGCGTRLVAFGRAGGLFPTGQSVDVHRNSQLVVATAPGGNGPGLAVTSDGQRSAWSPLADDVADGPDRQTVEDHLRTLLCLLVQIRPPDPIRIAFAVSVSPDGARLLPARQLKTPLPPSAHLTVAKELAQQLVHQ